MGLPYWLNYRMAGDAIHAAAVALARKELVECRMVKTKSPQTRTAVKRLWSSIGAPRGEGQGSWRPNMQSSTLWTVYEWQTLVNAANVACMQTTPLCDRLYFNRYYSYQQLSRMRTLLIVISQLVGMLCCQRTSSSGLHREVATFKRRLDGIPNTFRVFCCSVSGYFSL